ncbi:MAG: hypothetical protein U5K74_10660 [Gemmatimonadaceae bacterium]|nr:hypothetical protein [Gemmatimonadaceae bacterium]
MSGFQWLDIMDFPGQGTALVGMLNVFMENKGITDAESLAPVLLRNRAPATDVEEYTWTSDETFTAEVKIAHYGAEGPPERARRRGLCLPTATVERLRPGILGPEITIKQGLVHAGATHAFPLIEDQDASEDRPDAFTLKARPIPQPE